MAGLGFIDRALPRLQNRLAENGRRSLKDFKIVINTIRPENAIDEDRAAALARRGIRVFLAD